MKVGITLNDDLMSRIDAYADENYMSRSGFIPLACTRFLNSVEAMSAIRNLSIAVRKIADSGKIDHDTMEQLEDFERISQMLMGKQ